MVTGLRIRFFNSLVEISWFAGMLENWPFADGIEIFAQSTSSTDGGANGGAGAEGKATFAESVAETAFA